MPLRDTTPTNLALTKIAKLFKAMLAEEIRPSHVTVISAARAAAASSPETGWRGFHTLAVKLGLDEILPVRTALISLYSSLGDLGGILQLYSQSKSSDLFFESAAMSAMAKNGGSPEALAVFRRMAQSEKTKPNAVAAIAALSACGILKALLLCREIHGHAIKNLSPEINLQNSLIDVYARCGNFAVSSVIFDSMDVRDLVSWRTVIFRFHDRGLWRETLILFLRMMRSGAEPGENLITVAVDACSRTEGLGFLLGVHGWIVKARAASSTALGSALINAYAEFSNLEAARALFEGLIRRDVVAWTAMISAYGKSGRLMEALEIFGRMQEEDEENPNEITILGLIRACASAGDARRGRTLHAYAIRRGFNDNKYIASGMIDLYCKVGMMKQAEAVFEAREMLDLGLKPNAIVFVSILSACGHCGMVDEGLNWFREMDVEPELVHYSCLVDMLSRHGRVGEALEIIKNMPLKPDARIWAALLAGCRANPANLSIAEEAVGWLVRLDPVNNSSYSVKLSNLYAELGLWREVEKIRANLGDKGRKTMGFSKSTV